MEKFIFGQLGISSSWQQRQLSNEHMFCFDLRSKSYINGSHHIYIFILILSAFNIK